MKMDDVQLLKSLDLHTTGSLRDEPHAALSVEGRLMRRLLRSLGDPPMRITLWNGESIIPIPFH